MSLYARLSQLVVHTQEVAGAESSAGAAGHAAAIAMPGFSVGIADGSTAHHVILALHIGSAAVIIGSAIVSDLRVLGLGRAIPLDKLLRFVLAIALCATSVVIPSGVVMFTIHAQDLLASRIFELKLGLLLLAAVNAIAFHLLFGDRIRLLAPEALAPLGARLLAAVSIILWGAVVLVAVLLAESLG